MSDKPQPALSSTVEDYLKGLYLEQQRTGSTVSTGRLAELMGVSPGTVTAMLKTLASAELVDYAPRGGTRLSSDGERSAVQVLRRHRLVELFLVRVLGLDWSEVHVEAERLEHAISERVLDRMDELLQFPATDPHGDPIPNASGEYAPRSLVNLAHAGLTGRVRIGQVLDQDPQFLQFLDHHQLFPGQELELLARDPFADALRLRSTSGELTLGLGAAAKLLVEPRP